MFVDELEQHNILLNKFSIVREHILVTTKEFESQYNPLNASDWSAAWKCLTAPGVRPYVGFYNCGGKSGASVPHKHMQLLPRSLEDQDPFPPVGAALKYFVGKTDVGTPFSAQHLPFVHGFAFLPPSPPSDPGFILAQIFRKVLTHAFKSAQLDPSLCLNPPESVQTSTTLSSSTVAVESTEPPSYNVIFTKEWMMVVPRRKESVDRISINSVGFAGCLLAKSEENVELLRRKGCLNILVELGYPTKFGTPYAVV
ncbi:bifunctional AP-4-A phosphorylase/ADP sulfurylase [Rhizophlyctis rosea]|uniref:Bifunctional AP-4-A phosphorylase/ADP sulfurylase n=1 Tax=Rhizophlyctis rosea TaxID=64517 RepID=A0AAD5SK60_9FUNG|nr:bifunctional AP-4-A phosphorylase/ADP sulfurylase [Rhizophlyctis rosea]